jgi:hypothetical protein
MPSLAATACTRVTACPEAVYGVADLGTTIEAGGQDWQSVVPADSLSGVMPEGLRRLQQLSHAVGWGVFPGSFQDGEPFANAIKSLNSIHCSMNDERYSYGELAAQADSFIEAVQIKRRDVFGDQMQDLNHFIRTGNSELMVGLARKIKESRDTGRLIGRIARLKYVYVDLSADDRDHGYVARPGLVLADERGRKGKAPRDYQAVGLYVPASHTAKTEL